MNRTIKHMRAVFLVWTIIYAAEVYWAWADIKAWFDGATPICAKGPCHAH